MQNGYKNPITLNYYYIYYSRKQYIFKSDKLKNGGLTADRKEHLKHKED